MTPSFCQHFKRHSQGTHGCAYRVKSYLNTHLITLITTSNFIVFSFYRWRRKSSVFHAIIGISHSLPSEPLPSRSLTPHSQSLYCLPYLFVIWGFRLPYWLNPELSVQDPVTARKNCFLRNAKCVPFHSLCTVSSQQ